MIQLQGLMNITHCHRFAAQRETTATSVVPLTIWLGTTQLYWKEVCSHRWPSSAHYTTEVVQALETEVGGEYHFYILCLYHERIRNF